MRVILNTTSASYPLAGEYGVPERVNSGVIDFHVSAEARSQDLQRVRAATAGKWDRGNLVTTVSFTTRRVFSDHASAFVFCADLDAETPREGTVMFPTGAGTRHLLDAVVFPPTHRIQGCEVMLDYQARGSAVVTLLPAVTISSTSGGGLAVAPGGGGAVPAVIEDASLDGLEFRMVLDADGFWMEVGFPSPTNLLPGDAENGWTDPGGNLLFRIERSLDLAAWDHAVIACPTGIDDLGDDVWMYWARARTPNYWQTTLRDFRMGADLYGKSITGVAINGTTDITLSGYPYAMPADKARLQADLRTAGYSGALVTSSTAALTVDITDYRAGGGKTLTPTMSGTDVTGVALFGTPISLPGYPYSMPSQKAALQSALRTAGYSGAVVRLHADPWEIFVPNRSITGSYFPSSATYSPGDPFKTWDFFGTYTGEAPANMIIGTSENVRTPGGDPLEEADRQFFRLAVSAGPNNRY